MTIYGFPYALLKNVWEDSLNQIAIPFCDLYVYPDQLNQVLDFSFPLYQTGGAS